ncbi:MAG: hypothetical protein GY844_16760 [Bradyrhizobium sp.]|nr:hypothetical protein [Bradyrhizobium sp.]
MQEKHSFAWLACLVLTAGIDTAAARGIGQEHPYAAEHIDNLPADVRRAVLAHERACGGKAAATHYFSTSIATPTLSLLSLHFENFSCPNRGVLCSAAGCLHEIYAGRGMNYRRVFSVQAEDVRLTKAGDAVGLEVRRGGATQLYRWNGSGFVAMRP